VYSTTYQGNDYGTVEQSRGCPKRPAAEADIRSLKGRADSIYERLNSLYHYCTYTREGTEETRPYRFGRGPWPLYYYCGLLTISEYSTVVRSCTLPAPLCENIRFFYGSCIFLYAKVSCCDVRVPLRIPLLTWCCRKAKQQLAGKFPVRGGWQTHPSNCTVHFLLNQSRILLYKVVFSSIFYIMVNT
jgi:hypothetical protein